MPLYTREQATSVLERYPDLDPSTKSYWEAIVEAKLPNYYLAVFLGKRDDYLDDLPNIDVRDLITNRGKKDRYVDDSEYGTFLELLESKGDRLTLFKCQGNYLLVLSQELRGAIAEGVILDEAVVEDVLELLDSDLAFSVGDPNNQARIDRINKTLNLVIDHLQDNINNLS